ncbi:TPA: WxcM-like domain-containing protein [Clostridioides difficile]|uniref:WxcM domain-containing protein n=2 Tax=Clostridioides difficile TaxID=1496 RepID=A0AC59FVH0_CLODI|nr:FdtA/QdtA family cupin domain-containing protein [Clostridioides difficile]EQE25097.1 dTDP-6-deoxy-3,4-keto-hexulose isomerase [Clostridioides difficile CD17]EQE65848.1 dTDP-6-deoxy-3,4-keto-hexulose isomerase [Clostridioides difficile CD46]EQF84776.1 dTDP-6-deoxy-3,4-keto-hexulose isomerase [Clostridioides difficile 342]EQG32464.1 dTDP-6-deoxy-3,4-keto-hexulose isomerase [Clostridioides difficile DA00126]EQG78539.1 dTDP-6-deoxy-3,4-keto-hexulose isomerase [Clostridioides difficile DA00165]
MDKYNLIRFVSIGNEYIGNLVALESNKAIPFDIKRVYYIYDVPNNVKRGFHAHKNLEQVLVCLNGSVKIKCYDGVKETIFNLHKNDVGLYIGTGVWHEMFDFDEKTVLISIASEHYNEEDYIRDYKEFLKYLNNM